MKRTLKVLGVALLVSLVLGVVLVLGAVSMADHVGPATILVNGAPIHLNHLDGAASLLAVGGVALGLLITVLVVPLAVLIPLAIVAVLLIVLLLVLAGVLALVCSPLILALLVVWLMVRLIHRGPVKSLPASRATISG